MGIFGDILVGLVDAVFSGAESATRERPEYKNAYNEGKYMRPEELCRRIYNGADGPEKYGYYDALKHRSVSRNDAKKLCNKYDCYMVRDALKNNL